MKTRRRPPEALGLLQGLWALDHALQALSKRMLRDHGVSGPQRLLVRAIGQHPGCSPGRAARILHLHPGTVTRLAERLESGGFLERLADPLDARKVRLVLTEKGRRINGLRAGTVETAVQKVIDHSPSERVRAARRVLEEITAHLTEPAPRGDAVARGSRG